MTATAVLLGHNIGYSASPALHNAAFEALGIDARYQLTDVAPHDLPHAVDALRAPDRLGANVTQPHKLATCGLVDELAAEVDRLGAVNTIVRDGDRLLAYNTDLGAIGAEIEELARLHGARFRQAVVLGAGGASRAVVAALQDLGCDEIGVVRRADWIEMAERIGPADLLVNATPIGTASSDSPVAAALLRRDLAVLDLVYRPAVTRLVWDAREVGAAASSGVGVLLRQGMASFELWTRRPAPEAAMAAALRTELGITVDA